MIDTRPVRECPSCNIVCRINGCERCDDCCQCDATGHNVGSKTCDGSGCGHPCSVCSAAFGSPCDYDDEDRFQRCPDSKRECVCPKKTGAL